MLAPRCLSLLQRWEHMDAGIERADNRATIIFALGVAITMVLIPVTLAVSLVFGMPMLLARAAGSPDYSMLLYVGPSLLWSTLLAVFQNSIGERRGTVIISTIMFVVLIAATVSLVLGRNRRSRPRCPEYPT